MLSVVDAEGRGCLYARRFEITDVVAQEAVVDVAYAHRRVPRGGGRWSWNRLKDSVTVTSFKLKIQTVKFLGALRMCVCVDFLG